MALYIHNQNGVFMNLNQNLFQKQKFNHNWSLKFQIAASVNSQKTQVYHRLRIHNREQWAHLCGFNSVLLV